MTFTIASFIIHTPLQLRIESVQCRRKVGQCAVCSRFDRVTCEDSRCAEVEIIVDDEVFAACDVGICDHVIVCGGVDLLNVQLRVTGILEYQ